MGHQLPDELGYQVLLRLPAKSIFRFKSVSKDLNRLLSQRQFRLQYLARSKDAPTLLLGFFQFKVTTRPINLIKQQPEELSFRLSFLPTSDQGVSLNSQDFVKKLGFYYASSNSLILCGHHPFNYYVCNPITDKWFKLPRPNITTPPSDNPSYTIGFYCEQQLDHHRYKVVRAECTQYHLRYLKIETYSSESGVWRESNITHPCGIRLSTEDFCLAIKGTFFWNTDCKKIVAYDSDTSEDWFWLIMMPSVHCPSWVPILGESSDGRLQCAAYDDDDFGYRIYVLAKKLSCYSYSATLRVSEWNLSHSVMAQIPGMIRHRPNNLLAEHPRLIAFHPHNSRILYLREWNSIYVCDTWSGRVELVPYQGTLFSVHTGSDILPYFLPEWPSPLP